MRRKFNVFIIVAFFAIVSCQRQPKASFSTDKSEYVAGDTIYLSNTTEASQRFRWIFPDGQTDKSTDASYYVDAFIGDTTLTFKLIAISNNGKKADSTSKTVDIIASTGGVTFWRSMYGNVSSTTVTLNGMSSIITSSFTSEPDCGCNGCTVFDNLKVGKYYWSSITKWGTDSNGFETDDINTEYFSTDYKSDSIIVSPSRNGCKIVEVDDQYTSYP